MEINYLYTLMSKNIIYIAPSLSSFVRNDIKILKKKYNVTNNIYNWGNKYLTIFYFLKQFIFLLTNIFSTDLIIVSFGGYWAVLPSLFGRLFKVPVFIILNGTDCASIESINYGSLKKPLVKLSCKISYSLSSLLLPVSSSLIYTKNYFLDSDKDIEQGYSHFIKNIKTNSKVLYNGVDENFWKKSKEIKKEPNTFISVFNNRQFIGKGGDLIVEISKKYPSSTFYIAGSTKIANLEAPTNVIFLGYLSPNELLNYYSKCQYYFQLSSFEGFGVSLCEAMLCECVPIVSSVNHLANIVDDYGFVLQKKDINLLTEIVDKALNTKNLVQLGELSRKRIINNYSIEIREKELFQIIEEYI